MDTGGQQPVGKLSVKISPESPTVEGDLQAIPVGGEVNYRWERNGQVINVETGPVLPKDRYSKGDVISVTVTAHGAEGTASVRIRNSPPRITSVPFSPEYLHRGVDITVAPEAFDADGDRVRFRYKWLVNGEERSEDSVLKGDQFKKGDKIIIKVIPYDNDEDGVVFTSKPLVIPNAPPSFVSSPPQHFQGEIYMYHAKAEDPDGDILTYSLAAAPQGMTIDNKTGAIEWKINKEAAGTHTLEVVAKDPEGSKAIQKYSLLITIPGGAKNETR